MRPAGGALIQRVAERARTARTAGALQTIETEPELVEQHGVQFVVRVLAGPMPKDVAPIPGHNPFLPYEEELFVTDVSDTHFCLLNKFNVIDPHLLIVTREFEDQERLLTDEDFAAMWSCLAELGGLAFYNGGLIAGASQPHKHLQLVPRRFLPQQPGLPIDPLLAEAEFDGEMGRVPPFPFTHVVMRVDPDRLATPSRAAAAGRECYHAMLRQVGLPVDPAGTGLQSAPYNLLVTSSWMLLVPRSRHAFRGVPVNGLGFAGSLFVRNRQELQRVRELGPMTILREVGIAA